MRHTRHGVASASGQTCSLRMSNVLEIRYTQVLPTFADDRSRRLAAVKGRLSSRVGARSARRSSCPCSGSLPCGWRLPDRPPCRAVQCYRVRRARPPKVIVFAAAAVGVARVSGFDTTGARWCPLIVPLSHGPPGMLRERARSAYTRSVETCVN